MIKCTLVAFVGVFTVLGCSNHPDARATKEDAGPPAASAQPAPIVLVETPLAKLSKLATFDEALAFTKPLMEDTVNKRDEGSALLAMWSARSLRWADVVVAKNETSFAAILKDPDEARGKQFCASGSIIEIEVEKTKMGKIFDGLLQDYSGHLYKFAAVRSSGELVARSQARLCGVITGKHDYSNSGGGTGHAISIVGMFDLPENRLY